VTAGLEHTCTPLMLGAQFVKDPVRGMHLGICEALCRTQGDLERSIAAVEDAAEFGPCAASFQSRRKPLDISLDQRSNAVLSIRTVR
jgi:hypothetical protein